MASHADSELVCAAPSGAGVVDVIVAIDGVETPVVTVPYQSPNLQTAACSGDCSAGSTITLTGGWVLFGEKSKC